jgi:hypothetical protein
MPRRGTIVDAVLIFLEDQPDGATMREIGESVRSRRGFVPQHSIRSAVYSHLDNEGERLFHKRGGRNGRYFATR